MTRKSEDSRQGLNDLVHRITPLAVWKDLILPESQKSILQEIVRHVQQRSTVHKDWGFRARSDSRLGITVLFSGEDGTGKTMAAEVLANELKLDLYRIDLSQVVNKYIGETEKNLKKYSMRQKKGERFFYSMKLMLCLENVVK